MLPSGDCRKGVLEYKSRSAGLRTVRLSATPAGGAGGSCLPVCRHLIRGMVRCKPVTFTVLTAGSKSAQRFRMDGTKMQRVQTPLLWHGSEATCKHKSAACATSLDTSLPPTLLDRSRAAVGRWVSTLLPDDFPRSVAPWYPRYASWNALEMTSQSAAGVLSMQALLAGVLGSTGSSSSAALLPVGAAMAWVLKDGIGQLLTILFAGRFGSNFDANAKAWRLRAAATLDGAMLLEMLTPFAAPALFLPLASLSNAGKGVSMLVCSATRAAGHLTLVRQGNLGDLTGKATSQAIVASLTGMGVGLAVTPFAVESPYVLWAAFSFFCGTHIMASYKAAGSLVFATLNEQRLHMLAEEYASSLNALFGALEGSSKTGSGTDHHRRCIQQANSYPSDINSKGGRISNLSSPESIAEREKFVMPWSAASNLSVPLRIGAPLNDVVETMQLRGGGTATTGAQQGSFGGQEGQENEDGEATRWPDEIAECSARGYVLAWCTAAHRASPILNMAVAEGATPAQLTAGVLQAVLATRLLDSNGMQSALDASLVLVEADSGHFLSSLKTGGWTTSRLYLHLDCTFYLGDTDHGHAAKSDELGSEKQPAA